MKLNKCLLLLAVLTILVPRADGSNLFEDLFTEPQLNPAKWPVVKTSDGAAIETWKESDGSPALKLSPVDPEPGAASISSVTLKTDSRNVRISWQEKLVSVGDGGMFFALSDGNHHAILLRQTRFGDYRRKTTTPGALETVAKLQAGWTDVSLLVDLENQAVEMFYGDDRNAVALFPLIDGLDSLTDVRMIFGIDESTTQEVMIRDVRVTEE